MRPWLEHSPGDVKKLNFSLPRAVKLNSGKRRSRRWCAHRCVRAATFALSGRTRKSAFFALDSTQERRLLGRKETRPHGGSVQASQTISCHRRTTKRAVEPPECQSAEWKKTLWESLSCFWFSNKESACAWEIRFVLFWMIKISLCNSVDQIRSKLNKYLFSSHYWCFLSLTSLRRC